MVIKIALVVVDDPEQVGLALMQAHNALAELRTAIAVKPQAPTTQLAPAALMAGKLAH